MLETIEGMPTGTVGFRAIGKLTREDYREQLVPALEQAMEAGEVRMLYVLGPEFEGLESGALVEDAKAGFESLRNHSAFKRSAIATDLGWIRNGLTLFSWMVPGELKLFSADQVDEAKAWLAG